MKQIGKQKLYPLYENPTYIELVSYLVRHAGVDAYHLVRYFKKNRVTLHQQLEFLIKNKLVRKEFNGKRYWSAGKRYNYYLTDKGYNLYDEIIRYKIKQKI